MRTHTKYCVLASKLNWKSRRGAFAGASARVTCVPLSDSTCSAVVPEKSCVGRTCQVSPLPPAVANAFSASTTIRFVVFGGPAIGYGCAGSHICCHSSSVHIRAPIASHASSACGCVRLVHGWTSCLLHANV